MITHFLSEEQIAAYSRDFIERLLAFDGEDFPKTWLALGESGEKMAIRLWDLLASMEPAKADSVRVGFVSYDRKKKRVKFEDALEKKDIGGSPILVIDSAVHSGRSMLSIIDQLHAAGASRVVSYTLVMKRGSIIVPSYFGVLIDDKDRAYFDLNVLPNNRLHNKPVFGTLREISDSDFDLKIGPVGVPFEGITAGDLIYDRNALAFKVYVYTYGSDIAGFLTFRRTGTTIFLDAIGVPGKYQNKKIGGALMRWAETWARSNLCDTIELWAYEDTVPMYKKFDYRFTDSKWQLLSNGQKYRRMRKTILYNLRPDGTPTSA